MREDHEKIFAEGVRHIRSGSLTMAALYVIGHLSRGYIDRHRPKTKANAFEAGFICAVYALVDADPNSTIADRNKFLSLVETVQ